MPAVKSFRVHPVSGVPDKEMREWLAKCEREIGIISVQAVVVPEIGESNPRITLIVTKLDNPLD